MAAGGMTTTTTKPTAAIGPSQQFICGGDGSRGGSPFLMPPRAVAPTPANPQPPAHPSPSAFLLKPTPFPSVPARAAALAKQPPKQQQPKQQRMAMPFVTVQAQGTQTTTAMAAHHNGTDGGSCFPSPGFTVAAVQPVPAPPQPRVNASNNAAGFCAPQAQQQQPQAPTPILAPLPVPAAPPTLLQNDTGGSSSSSSSSGSSTAGGFGEEGGNGCSSSASSSASFTDGTSSCASSPGGLIPCGPDDPLLDLGDFFLTEEVQAAVLKEEAERARRDAEAMGYLAI